jgi:hypothetical protein
MRMNIQNIATARSGFTVEEHRWVQEQIETRAHKFWLARGSRQGAALSDWLQAEREVLEYFCMANERRLSIRSTSRRTRNAGAAQSKSRTTILNYCPETWAREPEEATARTWRSL